MRIHYMNGTRGEFQLEPPLDTEEGRTAADEWDER